MAEASPPPASVPRPHGEAGAAHEPRQAGDSPPEVLRDEQTLLGGVVQRLRGATGCELACAWALHPDGSPYVAAAAFDAAPPATLDAAAFAAAAALPGPCCVERGSAPVALAAHLARHPAAAIAPVRGADGGVLAVLWVSQRAGGGTRPRTLATLDAAARRLAGPLAAARAARRLERLDAELRRVDRLSSLGTLAAEIAHEVRNPLVSVKTFLQLLPERRDDPEFATQFLQVATGELERAERLLDLLVTHPRERADCGGTGPGEVVRAMSELLGHVARARGVELGERVAARLPRLALGEDPLRQVVLNLALNAVEVSPRGGRVQLEAHPEADGVELSISDSGPGVPAHAREQIFEPFHSTQGRGHGGLGLAIARRIVEEAGGSIRVDEADLGGARFRVWLPAEAGPRDAPA
jgi:signal transduction histidine kinase